MHSLSLAEYLQAAASAIAAGRLIQFGFSRHQRALLIFLTFNSVYLIALATLPPRSHGYFTIYLFGTIIYWVVSVIAVREMFALTFDSYPGIRTAGRWVLYSATGLAIAASVVVSFAFRHASDHGSAVLYWSEVSNRFVVLTLAIVIAAIVRFLSHYPLHLSRNTYISTGFFSAVFFSEAVMLIIDSPSRFLYRNWVDVTQVVFAGVCFCGWALLLRPELAAPSPQRISFESPAEHELLQHLDSLNRLLSRAGRR
jgi:hypothetical protein